MNLYTQEGNHYRSEGKETNMNTTLIVRKDMMTLNLDTRMAEERHYRDHAQRSDSESRTTDLFKQLSRETNDQDMLFNALMLYAREITKIYMMTMRVVHLADMIMKMRE